MPSGTSVESHLQDFGSAWNGATSRTESLAGWLEAEKMIFRMDLHRGLSVRFGLVCTTLLRPQYAV